MWRGRPTLNDEVVTSAHRYVGLAARCVARWRGRPVLRRLPVRRVHVGAAFDAGAAASFCSGASVIGVCNFPEKNIAGVVSQVLILGSIDKEGKVILVHPSQKSENGLPVA